MTPQEPTLVAVSTSRSPKFFLAPSGLEVGLARGHSGQTTECPAGR